MAFSHLFKKTELFTKENSSTILTAVGVVGTVSTSVLTGRSTIKAVRLRDAAVKEMADNNDADPVVVGDAMSTQDTIRLVWQEFIPPVTSGVVTIASIIMANRISSKRAAALAAAYGLSEKAFNEYREKVFEKIGENKERAVRDDIAQDRVKKQPPTTQELVFVGDGDVLCFDMLSGRYFQSSVEKIRKAENTINHEIIQHEYASLSRFYDEIGLPPTMFSEEVGFNHANMVDVRISTVMSIDDRTPCVAFSFAVGPVQNYARLY